MKARIRGIEITDITLEELDDLIQRYGEDASTGPGLPSPKPGNGSGANGGSPQDRIILERFVAGGSNGVHTTELGHLLGKQGKGVKPALDRWAKRIKLVVEDNSGDPFEKARPDGDRGWRLRSALLPVAAALLEEMK
jgi:hypothetical protein